MPALPNPRHELFAQEIAKGVGGMAAYVAAGFDASGRSASANASRLLATDNIAERVSELQAERARMSADATAQATATLSVSLQWLMEKAEAARVLAMDNGQAAAAVSAIKELGVLSGHRVERRENTLKSANDLSDDELLAIARGEIVTTH